jgi:opacity protein-like surface antigen
MFSSSIIRAALLTAVVAPLAAAQRSSSIDTGSTTLSELARRSSASLAVVQSRPQGAFGRNVGIGYGASGAYLFRLDDAGIWSIRADAGIVTYGNESRRTALSETVGDRVQVDVKTSNYIVPLTLGAQLAWPRGPVRPYANVGVGGQAFFTESHLEGADDASAFGSTTNHSSWAASWAAGGGLSAPIYVGKTTVQLDIGLQYVAGSHATYLSRGSIVDLPRGAIRISPLESPTHMVIMYLGTRIGR